MRSLNIGHSSQWNSNGNDRRKRQRSFEIQPLEPRTLLAGHPIISEFQAVNASTIADEDSDFEDWIEIENTGTEAIDLNGWYLTDDSNDLTKWQFPSVTLPSEEQLLVFASSKDRTEPGSQLHTNFKLSGDGEFLALVMPDGTTIAQDFGEAYPEQVEDQSYGLAFFRQTSDAFTSTADVRSIVPADDSLGLDWTQAEFNDAAWSSGSLGVGYELLATGFTETESFDAPLGAEWTLEIPAGSPATAEVTGGVLNMNVPTGHDTSFFSRGTAPMATRSLPAENLGDFELITHVSHSSSDRGAAGIVVTNAASGLPAIQLEYSGGLVFQMLANGEVQGSGATFGSSGHFLRLVRDGRENTWSGFYKINEADDWTHFATAEDGINGVPTLDDVQVGLYARTPTSTMNASFSSFDVVIPSERPTYASRIGHEVTEMNGQNSSIYMRIPFTIEGDAGRFEEMDLTTSFDDGFRAYLNGVEVAAENVPIIASWDSAASSEFGAVDDRIPVRSLNLADSTGALKDGVNVLAIHGMNAGPNDKDFFFEASMTIGEITSAARPFLTPTPNDPNSTSAAPTPTLIAEEGVFFGSTTIELTLPDPSSDFEIRYTIDGEEPTIDSTLYSGPFELTESAMFQAKAFGTSTEVQIDPSNPVSGTFFAVAEELRDRDSNVPLVILDTIGQRIPGSGSTSLASTNVLFFDVDTATGRSKIDDGIVDYMGRGGIRDRGSSTSGQAKPNLSFETWGPTGTTKDDDFDASLAGLPAESDWVLHAPFNFDRALIRNQFHYSLSNEIGRWSPHTRPVEVYLNRRDGVVTEGDFAGLYVLTEKIKRGPDRVDIAGLTPQDNAEPDISGGYIWKIDRTDPSEPSFNGGGQGSLNWVYPKSPRSRTARDDQKVTEEQQDWVINFFNEFRASLGDEETRDLDNPEGYTKYVDALSAVDHGLMNVLSFNVDALRLSAYLYKERGKPFEYGPLWDCDRCMESTDNRDDSPEVWGDNFFTYTWWRDMFRDPNFWQLYVDRWAEFRRDVFSEEGLDRLIDRQAVQVEESSSRNIAKWRQNPRTASQSPFKSGALDGTWRGEVEHMRTWLHARAEFMDSNFVQPPSVFVGTEPVAADASGLAVAAGTEIEIAGPIGTVFDDTELVAGEVGVTNARYAVPIDDSLGEDWAAIDFDDSNWASGTTGIGFGTSRGFPELIQTEIDPRTVQEGATTVLMRIDFNIADLDTATANELVLRMKYDDGFVAYINGTRVLNQNLRTNDLTWNSRANTHRNSDAVLFEDFDLSEFKDLLVEGRNVLSIRGINSSASSNDMLFVPALVSRITNVAPNPAGMRYYTTDGTDPRGRDGQPTENAILAPVGSTFTVTENVRITARNFDDVTDRGRTSGIVGTDWSGLTTYNFVVEDAPLVISEINYNPVGPTEAELAAIPGLTDEAFEFLEVYNPSSRTVQLTGVEITDGVEFDFVGSGSSEIGAGERLLVVSNQAAFELRYGTDHNIAGEFSGALNNAGEDIDLIDGVGQIVFSVNYGQNDPWAERADGSGATLELVDPDNTPADLQNKYYSWRASREYGGSPGTAGQGPVGVVINEVISHTEGAVTTDDSIELYNSTDGDIDISGWYLSDSGNDPFKFQIPAETVLASGSYVVFSEDDFNPTPDDRQPNHFALSGEGDNVWLVIGDGTQVTSFVDDVRFRATPNGQSLGRLPNGSGRLAPLGSLTFGEDNGSAATPAIAITEVNYNPGLPNEAALAIAPLLSRDDLEFIELHNPTTESALLTDWRIRGGADFSFDDGATIAPNESVVLVKFNPDSHANVNRLLGFKAHYGIDDSVQIIGGYGGQLNNSDDQLILLRPDTPPEEPDVIRVQEDEVLYDDQLPWQTNADGTGHSLQRVSAAAFGNDPRSWIAAEPSPGSVGDSLPGDFDGSGVVDATDIDLLAAQTRTANPDLAFDLSGDQRVNGDDRDILVVSILGTNYGDSDLDGVFGTADLVSIFTVGEYEDGIAGNSTWSEGDWNGDGDFDTADLVLAFTAGAFSADAAHPLMFESGNLVIDSIFEEMDEPRAKHDDDDLDLIMDEMLS